jgi:hypothetical protein
MLNLPKQMPPDSTKGPSHFIKRKLALLASIAVLVALVVLVALSWLSVTIKRFPSCLTYQSEGNARLAGLLRTSFGDYLAANGFEAASSGSEEVTWGSRATYVLWSSGSTLYLSVCTKNEESSDWLAVAQDLQELALRAHWAPEAFLGLNPDVTGCRAGNDMRLRYPIDFKVMGASIEHLKATCGGGRRL